MSETKSDRLNRLYKEYGLSSEDVFKHRNFSIITRAGINKIEASANITVGYEIIPSLTSTVYVDGGWKTSAAVLVRASMSSKEGEVVSVETTGEANNENVKQNPPYMLAMAEKRAKSRAVLILTGFYALGVFGEDESDDFKRPASTNVSKVQYKGNA